MSQQFLHYRVAFSQVGYPADVQEFHDLRDMAEWLGHRMYTTQTTVTIQCFLVQCIYCSGEYIRMQSDDYSYEQWRKRQEA